MAKIAIVDLLFYWPPGGGSFIDVKEVAEKLSLHHEVVIFVPQIKNFLPFQKFNLNFLLKKSKFFLRGTIKSPFNIKVVPIEFNSFDFNLKSTPRKFLLELKKFKPEYVFLTQGWQLKPYLLNYLDEYKKILRFYTYEGICPKGDGHLFKQKRICNVNLLDFRANSYLSCLFCASSFLLTYPSPVFIQEYLASLAFLPSFRKTFVKSLENASTVIVYNHYLKDKLSKFSSNIEVVPSGVNIKLFGTKSPKKPNDIKEILVPSRSDDFKKGFDVIFDVASKIWNYRKDFRILVTVRDNLKRKYRKDFVKNLGWIQHKELPKIYNQSDIVVVPSQWPEPFGIVAVEGMASHTPIIASRVGGLQTIVEDGRTGYLFDPLNKDELEQKLIKLLDNTSLRLKMGEEGKKKAEKEYDWEAIYNKYYKRIFV